MALPTGTTVSFQNGTVTVKGPKGSLSRPFPPTVHVTVADEGARVTVDDATIKNQAALWGTYASHLKNMIVGVTNGFSQKLEINGVGYRVAMQGKDLKIEVGFSHPVIFAIPEGVTASVEKNMMTLVSTDKELLGQTAAKIRSVRKPEPYKGKGIKYVEETIRRKAGKTAKSSS